MCLVGQFDCLYLESIKWMGVRHVLLADLTSDAVKISRRAD